MQIYGFWQLEQHSLIKPSLMEKSLVNAYWLWEFTQSRQVSHFFPSKHRKKIQERWQKVENHSRQSVYKTQELSGTRETSLLYIQAFYCFFAANSLPFNHSWTLNLNKAVHATASVACGWLELGPLPQLLFIMRDMLLRDIITSIKRPICLGIVKNGKLLLAVL